MLADMTIAGAEPLVRRLEAVCYIDEADALDAVVHHGSFNIIHLEASCECRRGASITLT